MWWLLAATIAIAPAGEVLDRIAVTVGNSVITESEVVEQIKLTAFLNNTKPVFDAESRRAAADRLVEQMLIRREIAATGYGGNGSEGPVKLSFPSDAEYRRALKEYGLSDAEVKRHLKWQNTLLSFIDTRFRPGIQISEAEARDYYDREFLPAARKQNNGASPEFEAARMEIEQVLTDQRANQALDRWLGQARTQTRIRYRPEVFR